MCSVFKLNLNNYNIEDVCRVCGKCDVITTAGLVNIFTADHQSDEKNKVLREFELWNLSISEDDGFPQKMCKQCFGKFTLVHNFRKQCESVQQAFKVLLLQQRTLNGKTEKSEKLFRSSPVLQVQPKQEKTFSEDYDEMDCFDEIPFEDGEYKDVDVFALTPAMVPAADGDLSLVGDKDSFFSEGKETSFSEGKIDSQLEENNQPLNNDGIENANDVESDDGWDKLPADIVPKVEYGDDESSMSSDLLSSDDERRLRTKSKTKPNQFKCEYCKNHSLPNQEELDAHVSVIHSGDTPYTCPLCTKTFVSAKQRNCHFMVSHRWKSHECDVCHKMIKGGKPGLKNHKDNVHNKSDYECEICNKKFENISLNRFRYHQRWHDKSKLFTCKTCDKTFVTRYHMDEHERTHTDEKSFLCNVCGLGLRCKQNLIWHMKTHTGERTYQCNTCSKSFPTPTALACHVKTHSHEKNHECHICNKLFKTKGSLKTHIANVHKVDFKDGTVDSAPRFQCQLCPRHFTFERDLIKHLKTHERRRHVCETCGLSYLQSSHLKKHVETVHLNIRPFVCNVCGHAFPFEFNLKQHEATHKEKEFKCMICDKEFTLLPSLISHQRTHTGEKPYQCHLCEKAFTNRGNLKTHVEKHLLEQKANQTFQQIVLPVIQPDMPPPDMPPPAFNLFDLSNANLDQNNEPVYSNQL